MGNESVSEYGFTARKVEVLQGTLPAKAIAAQVKAGWEITSVNGGEVFGACSICHVPIVDGDGWLKNHLGHIWHSDCKEAVIK